MEPKLHEVAIINFITKDASADVVGYLNFPPCDKAAKQHEVFNDMGELKVRYKNQVKNLDKHITVYDKWQIAQVAMLNDWDTEPSHAVIELVKWDTAYSRQ